MIAAANGNGGEDDREFAVSPPATNGGQMGGIAPNVELNDLRVRDNARRLSKLIEAGAIAAEGLIALAQKIEKRIRRKCTDRDLAALGKLQLQISQAADAKGAATTNININAPQQVQVIYVDDWYGSKAASIAATNGAPASGPNVG